MIQGQKVFAEWDVSSKVVAFTTTRQGGVSEAPYASFNLGMHVGDDPDRVTANRLALLEGFPKKLQWQWLNQVHGSDVVAVREAGSELTADALLTKQLNLVCCVQTADCLPLFVAAIDGSEVAMIHAGWKGLASGVIESTVAAMSTSASRLGVWLGPAIGPCHFEVGGEVKDCFLETAEQTSTAIALEKSFSPSNNRGKFMADIFAIARHKLSEIGVKAVSGGDCCTYCDAERFFSYRRDGFTGRLLNAIYIEA